MNKSFSRWPAAIAEFIKSSSAGPGKNWEAEFNRLALELFGWQFSRVEPFRKYCHWRGVEPRNLGSWRQIPAMPAASFKDLDLTSLPESERSAVFYSSGTTGQRRSRHWHSAESLALYEASLWPWFQRHLVPDPPQPLVVLSLIPPWDEAPHSSLACMFDKARARFGSNGSMALGRVTGDGSWTLDWAAAEEQFRHAEQGGTPVLILATAFALVQLLDFFAERRIRFELPEGSRLLETGGYKGRSRTVEKTALYQMIQAGLDVREAQIVCEYGMSELSSQAYDRVAGQAGEREFRFPPWARFEIIDVETGDEADTGLLRILDLANVESVLAVQTEDLASRAGGGFRLLGRAELAEPRGCSRQAQ